MFEFYERLILVIYLVLISCVNSGIMCDCEIYLIRL